MTLKGDFHNSKEREREKKRVSGDILGKCKLFLDILE